MKYLKNLKEFIEFEKTIKGRIGWYEDVDDNHFSVYDESNYPCFVDDVLIPSSDMHRLKFVTAKDFEDKKIEYPELIFIGNVLDNTIEHELNSYTEYGFNVIIKFKPNKKYSGTWMLRNVTEVHYLYDKYLDETRVAFESDIHDTGRTNEVNDIEQIIIQCSDKKYENFWEVYNYEFSK